LNSLTPGEYRLADPFIGANRFNSIPELSHERGFEKLERLLTAEAAQHEREDAIYALRLLEGIADPTQATLSAMQALAISPDPEIALTAISVQLNRQKPEDLQTLVTYLNGYNDNADPWALTNIGTKLAQFRDDHSTPLIRELTRSKYTSVRDGAMRALRARKDPHMAQTLVDRLEDSSRMIQYLAVISLAETFGRYDQDYAPSMYLFDKRPQYYTALWKYWWTDEGSKLYPTESTPQ
jgi:HEAT repeat protein